MRILQSNSSWIQSPVKKQAVIALAVWAVGIICSPLALTNLFAESLFKGKNAMMMFLMATATFTISKVLLNYRKSTRKMF